MFCDLPPMDIHKFILGHSLTSELGLRPMTEAREHRLKGDIDQVDLLEGPETRHVDEEGPEDLKATLLWAFVIGRNEWWRARLSI